MGILADRNHNYVRSRSFGVKWQLVCPTAFKGKSQLFLSVLCPLQLLKQNEDSHFCPKQWGGEISSGWAMTVNRKPLWELSSGKKRAALRLLSVLPRIRWSLPRSFQTMAASYLLHKEVPAPRNCSASRLYMSTIHCQIPKTKWCSSGREELFCHFTVTWPDLERYGHCVRRQELNPSIQLLSLLLQTSHCFNRPTT